jgi:hypothetical protein
VATVQRYVNTASSGGDGTTNGTAGATAAYASLSSWEANQSPSGTDDLVVDCCGSSADSTAVTLDWATAPASVTVQANASDPAGKYNGADLISTSHYRLVGGAGATTLMCTDVSDYTIDGIQVETSGGSFRAAIGVNAPNASKTFTFRNNRVRAAATTRTGIGMPGSAVGHDSQTFNIVNNLIVGFDTGIELLSQNFRSPTFNIYQNTIYGDGSANLILLNFSNGSGVGNIKNNCGWNSGASAELSVSGTAGFTANYDTNAFQDGNGTTNEITLASTAATWTSAGTGQSADFTPVTGSPLLAAGVTGLSITTDINGTTRDATPDIGAIEVAAGGGGTDADVDLTGVGATGSVGTLAATVTITLAAVTATGSVGTLTVTLDSTASITGVSATGAVGDLTALAGTVVSITGVAGTGSAGTLGVTVGDSITLTGVSATGQVGTLTVQVPADVTVNLSGVSATGGVGDLIVSFDATWTPVGSAGGTWTAVIPGSAIWTPQ